MTSRIWLTRDRRRQCLPCGITVSHDRAVAFRPGGVASTIAVDRHRSMISLHMRWKTSDTGNGGSRFPRACLLVRIVLVREDPVRRVLAVRRTEAGVFYLRLRRSLVTLQPVYPLRQAMNLTVPGVTSFCGQRMWGVFVILDNVTTAAAPVQALPITRAIHRRPRCAVTTRTRLILAAPWRESPLRRHRLIANAGECFRRTSPWISSMAGRARFDICPAEDHRSAAARVAGQIVPRRFDPPRACRHESHDVGSALRRPCKLPGRSKSG